MSSLLALISGNGDPYYSINQTTTSVNEGSSVVFTITTVNVAPSTTLYWTLNTVSGTINSSDFQGGATTGSFTTNSSGVGTVSITLANDSTTEGGEQFQLQVRTGSTSGTIVKTSDTITINDTSLNPTYSVSPSTTTIGEGSSVTFTINTQYVDSGTTLYYTINTISGTVDSSDFSSGSLSGSFSVSGTHSSSSGTVTLTLANDYTTEGSESFQLQVRTGSISGTIVATSSTVTISDTSVPTYSVSPSTTSVNEGSSVTFTISTNGVANGTTLYYTLNAVSGTINSSDFSSGSLSGSLTVSGASGTYNTGGTASVSYTLANDYTTEGSESFQLQVRTGSISGTIVATSSTVTINDTSIAADITYHVISGGGGGGNARQGQSGPGDALDCASGGGGGGGYLTGTFTATTGSPYPLTIGAGGGVYPTATQSVPGVRGGSSTFGPITLTGGAGGEVSTDPALYFPWFHNTDGSSGSGGAGGYISGGASLTGNTANPASQGYPGGNGSSNPGTSTGTPAMLGAGGGGGGGGATGAGENATPTSGGSGGAGINLSPFGFACGGGGGGCNVYNGSAGTGSFGGGNGGFVQPVGPTNNSPSVPPSGAAAAGQNATGRGGGGGGAAVTGGPQTPSGSGYGAGAFGGNGGAGGVILVIPSYHTATLTPGFSYTQPTPTVFVFTAGSGSITFNNI